MRYFQAILYLSSFVFLAISCNHIVLGPTADIFLGANISVESLNDPVLDSQNRFFGAILGLLGALFFICAMNPLKYAAVFYTSLAFFFMGGVGRVISMMVTKLPPNAVIVFTVLEFIIPVLLALWLRSIQRNGTPTTSS